MLILARLLCLASVVSAQQAWSGWPNINKAFVFGASYAVNGFDVNGHQPDAAAGNPFGNPPGSGRTSSDGPNVVEYLTTMYNASLISTYDLAVSGAVIDGALYDNHKNDFAAQLDTKFFLHYSNQERAGWNPAQTLFAFFFAINDVRKSFPRSDNPLDAIFSTYTGLLEELYSTGARNFLILKVPPINRAPHFTSLGPCATTPLAAFIAAFNGRLLAMTDALTVAHPDAKIFVFDTHALFERVLDDPASLPQTTMIRNTDGYCPAYRHAMGMYDFKHGCGLRVDEYFWLNELHPTWPVHDAMASEIAKMLGA